MAEISNPKLVMKRINILLDMDEVLVDFFSGALTALNKAHSKTITKEQYAAEYGKWNMQSYYGITDEQFWGPIDSDHSFWVDLNPIPWYQKLYDELLNYGDVTVVTAPGADPECSRQKLEWLDLYLGIKSDAVFLGHRKFLFAGNGVLIDDSPTNVAKFREAGGDAILVPANWNTVGLAYDQVWKPIQQYFDEK